MVQGVSDNDNVLVGADTPDAHGVVVTRRRQEIVRSPHIGCERHVVDGCVNGPDVVQHRGPSLCRPELPHCTGHGTRDTI